MGTADSVIAAAKIDGQIFYAPDPHKVGYSHVFAYRGSSYVVPEHHYSPDGRLLDLNFWTQQRHSHTHCAVPEIISQCGMQHLEFLAKQVISWCCVAGFMKHKTST